MANERNEQTPQKSLLDAYDDETVVELDMPNAPKGPMHVGDLKAMEQAGMITVHQRPDGSIFFRLTEAAYQYTAALRN
jgi:hypothetical protein